MVHIVCVSFVWQMYLTVVYIYRYKQMSLLVISFFFYYTTAYD